MNYGRTKVVVCLDAHDLGGKAAADVAAVLRMSAELTCAGQVRRQLYDKVRPGRVELLCHDAPDPEEEARRFEGLLRSAGPAR
jgi:hypothetical protein